ncbi:phosphate signaling complex protein PhoU [Candidatus Chloroploca sp. M-50]|uniref:Phosphate-specific transport system accessory protein PhoU n=1 Tax=Candidatus Chloroploca mongolica TaxID=2528176 RepID=A0ABS4D6N6_9CHLR|nr:phosphate signaling complex protein PhoU [Candidatus Chloroploca mongolica]MBP1465103.1 phosphate signaling complex protein PhoU [Candidatus Chloroploca mongolica]
MMRVRDHFDAELASLRHQVQDLGVQTNIAIERALTALTNQDRELAQEVQQDDRLINTAQRALEDHAIALVALQQPVARDLRSILSIIAIGSELERIGDYAKGIARMVLGGEEAEPLEPPADLMQLATMVQGVFGRALDVISNGDFAAAQALAAEEAEVDLLYRQVKHTLAHSLASHPNPARAADFLLIAHKLERIGDRSTNIAERVVYWLNAQVVELNP